MPWTAEKLHKGFNNNLCDLLREEKSDWELQWLIDIQIEAVQELFRISNLW